MAESPAMVPARYIGQHATNLVRGVRRYYNIDGTLRTKHTLEAGETLMMPAQEILGQTLLFDPHNVRPPKNLGIGKRVLPEDAEKSERELSLLGYEFHQGRSDFEPMSDADVAAELAKQAAPADTKPAQNAAPAADTPPATPADTPSTELAAPVARVMGG